ncbi:MAG: 50S ribosomal protein L15 [Lentisphaerae bacterium]|nr:50S ribosomal protein L15 [Lentisphaerota bacterium]
MDLSSLKNTPGARKSPKRVGRGPGSGMGKTSGRGHKGQMARKGHKHKVGFEGGQMPLMRRIPKRGFKNPNRVPWQPINVAVLNRFDEGSEVTPVDLLQAGLIRINGGGVKILGNGNLEKKLTVRADAFSESARAKIEAAGGTAAEYDINEE